MEKINYSQRRKKIQMLMKANRAPTEKNAIRAEYKKTIKLAAIRKKIANNRQVN